MIIAQVALPVGGAEVYDYVVPESLTSDAAELVGRAARVPFARRSLNGVIMHCTDASAVPLDRLRPITALRDRVLDDSTRELLQFAARHYRHPLGLTLATATPAGLLDKAPRTRRDYRVTPTGEAALASAVVRGQQQRAALEVLTAAAPDAVTREALAVSDAVLRALRERDWIMSVDVAASAPPASRASAPVTLRPAQQACVQRLALLRGFQSVLLHGPTGSGKTEIYLALAAMQIAAGKQVLMLVPEIALTPHMVQRIRQRLGGRIAVLHSARSDGERRAVWHAALQGTVDCVLATRSGIFLPLPRLGLIIVDEEHDGSYKQQDGLRYSARDLAVYRAQLQQVTVILGSATPALETLHNARTGRYLYEALPSAAQGQRDLRLIDLRPFPASEPLSPPLQQLIRQHLDRGGQIFLFLNRRGFAPVLYCAECQWIPQCPHCDSALVWHRDSHGLRCHHCDSRHPVPGHCPGCESTDLIPVGWGTQRIMDALTRHFPGVPALRFDRDSLRARSDLEQALEAIDSNTARIVVGTQMLAKGHDFPHLSLVAVMDADGGLFSTDFRAPERLGQLLTQVRGRAGRRAQDATCVVQTRSPQHPYLQAWLTQDYTGLSETLLTERAATSWPPYSQLALLRIDSPDAAQLAAFWEQFRMHVAWPPNETECLGPVVRPRRAGRHRSQLLLRAPSRKPLGLSVDHLRHTLEHASWARRVRWSLDMDPWSLD